jgi:Undecaprenyl-phosphate glucose phosphotransferase
MLKRNAFLFNFFRSLMDICMITAIWIMVYYVRFKSGLFSTPKGISSFDYHLSLVFPIVAICILAFIWTGLYKPHRIKSLFRLVLLIIKAAIVSGLLVSAFFYYLRNTPYSRNLLILFVGMLFLGLIASHFFVAAFLRHCRRKGYNQRYCAIIGTGTKAQQLVQDLNKMEWAGLKCSFFVDDKPALFDTQIMGIPVFGPIEKTPELVQSRGIDEVYVVFSGGRYAKVNWVLESLQSMGVTIRIVPDWGRLVSISTPAVTTIGSQFLFSAGDSPLSGINIIIKEVFDRFVSFVVLTVLSPLMLIIAVMIKLTSKGPVFYKQTRIGMDQQEFQIYKFRTMKVDAEKENGPEWARPNDSRCTGFGSLLRKTSMDELPQLINVLKGEMSLVGPRPERPHFVKIFSENHRRYMLRHKVKAGMTGWAQVNGLRGNTSLRKRLAYDLYYVTNWSFGLDLWILLRTPIHLLRNRNAC